MGIGLECLVVGILEYRVLCICVYNDTLDYTSMTVVITAENTQGGYYHTERMIRGNQGTQASVRHSTGVGSQTGTLERVSGQT